MEMKTIEVTDEMYDALVYLSKEITTQDHRATRQPYFFQVITDIDIPSPEGVGNQAWYMDGTTLKTAQEIKEVICEYMEWDPLSVEYQEEYDKLEDYRKEQLLEYMGYRIVWYETKQEYQNAFLTDISCREHIEDNKHNYRNPSTYLQHAWRNPDMETIFKFLAGLSGKEIHT